jgi:hypothetical protein
MQKTPLHHHRTPHLDLLILLVFSRKDKLEAYPTNSTLGSRHLPILLVNSH